MKITIEAARVNVKMTQKSAAAALGIARSTYSSYENGKTKPDVEMARKIADLFGRTMDEIKFNQ